MSSRYDVFISYRREGGLDHARTICREFQQRGFRCFFDYNELKTGKFTDGIRRAVEGCAYFVLILTDGSLDRCNKDVEDWVRQEIELAISLKKPIIPICPSGNERGFPAQLPPTLEELRAIQISRLDRDDLFEASVEAIVRNRLRGVKVAVVRKRLPQIFFSVLLLLLCAAAVTAIVVHRQKQAQAALAARAEEEMRRKHENQEALVRAQAAAAAARAQAEAAQAEAEATQARALADERAREVARAQAEADRFRREEEARKRQEEERRAAEEKARQERLRLEQLRLDQVQVAEAQAQKAEQERATREKAEQEAAARAQQEEDRRKREAAKNKLKRLRNL